jgi:hypothetical protein
MIKIPELTAFAHAQVSNIRLVIIVDELSRAD